MSKQGSAASQLKRLIMIVLFLKTNSARLVKAKKTEVLGFLWTVKPLNLPGRGRTLLWFSRRTRHQEIMPLIRDIFWHHQRRYGARRVAVELQAQGRPCGVERVAKLLKTQGLQAIQPQPYKPQTTGSRHALGCSPNLLQRSTRE
jgi:helix-turn-helix protein